jgi:hypothetical protein
MRLKRRMLLGRVPEMPRKVTCSQRHGDVLYLQPLLAQILVQDWEVRLEQGPYCW